jgi:solute carrier family 12 (potassium/chloride transporter), member 4/6
MNKPSETVPVASGGDAKKLGAFLGVFTPSILTILGVIMYLRFGWVVGHEGLFKALLIVAIANCITLISALSVSAVASNMHVGVGGAYYIISRSLGLEIGGAIGLPLFLSQALSVTLYAFGLAESLRFVWPNVPILPVTAGIIVLITLLALRGAEYALKAQIPIMIFIGLSFVSLLAGSTFDAVKPILSGSHPESPGFWIVFAVFFPAVTGILAGISMSGDLKDPKRAIPRGAIGAVLVGFVVYLLVPFVLAFNADRTVLVSDSLVWSRIAWIPWLIFPGLWGAILSSAVGSILSAPRTLQALSIDRIVPRIFGRCSRENGEPWIAIVFTAGIALTAVLLGGLNIVAPVLTMFFLTTYGMVNLVAGLENVVGDPSYRPQLKVKWYVSLLGAVGCFWVMFLISKAAFAVALLIEGLIWLMLRRRSLEATWGDMRRGFWMALTRQSLLMLKELPEKPRGWRPNILLFAGDVDKRLDLVRFATWFGQNKGIVTVCNMIEGDLKENISRVNALKAEMRDFLDSRGMMVFSEVDVVRDFETGILEVCQANGIAGLESNTLMFGWSDHMSRLASYFRIMRQAGYLYKSMIICRIKPRQFYNRTKRIDLWWGGQQRNGDIMLLLSHLLSLNPEWHGCHITIKSIARSASEQQSIVASLDKMIPEIRINCERQVFLKSQDVSIKDCIHQESRDAEVVFLGLAQPDYGNEEAYADRLLEIVNGLGTTVLVKNSCKFAGGLIS